VGLFAAGAVADDGTVVNHLDAEGLEIVVWSMSEVAGEVKAC
jgi:hypothetical protein